jgi:hypothetical protein
MCISFFSKAEIEDIVVFIRLSLYNRGLPCSAKAIRQEMEAENVQPLLPSPSTIHRILIRHGLTHGRTGFYS